MGLKHTVFAERLNQPGTFDPVAYYDVEALGSYSGGWEAALAKAIEKDLVVRTGWPFDYKGSRATGAPLPPGRYAIQPEGHNGVITFVEIAVPPQPNIIVRRV